MRSRPRSKSQESDSGASPKGRRGRFRRQNSGDSNVSYGNESENSFSNSNHYPPAGFIEPPAWNQPAYSHSSKKKSKKQTNYSAHSNHSNYSNYSNYSSDSDGAFHSADDDDENDVNHNQNNNYNRFNDQQELQRKLQQKVQQQQQQQQQSSYSVPNSPQTTPTKKKKGIRRLLSRSSYRKRDESVSSRTTTSKSIFGRSKRRSRKNSEDSDLDYQSDTNYNYNNTYNSNNNTKNNNSSPPKHIKHAMSFGHKSNDSDDPNESFEFDPSQSHNPHEPSEYSGYDRDASYERDASMNSYEIPVVDHSDSEYNNGNNGFMASFSNLRKPRGKSNSEPNSHSKRKKHESPRASLNQNDHLQLDFEGGYSSSDGGSHWDGNSFGGDSRSRSNSSWDDHDTTTSDEFSLNMSARSDWNTHGDAVDYSRVSKHQKDLASQNLQAIESMARKEGPNRADEAFQIFPDHAYPNTKMTRRQLRKHMNARSAYYHDLRMPGLSKKKAELGRLRVEVLQCFGLPTTSLVKEVSAYAVVVMGSGAFQTDVIPNVANPMWLSKMRRACLFPVETMYQKLSIGIFDLEAAYAHPDTVIGHPGHPGWIPPDQRNHFGFHRSSSFAGLKGNNSSNTGSMYAQRGSSASFGIENLRSSSGHFTFGDRRGSGYDNRRGSGFDGRRSSGFDLTNRRGSGLIGSKKHLEIDEDEEPGKLPTDNPHAKPVPYCTRAEDFIGHVVIDVCRLRPGSTYDVTLPLRRSKHVFTREPQGSIRVRLHLEWTSERSAVMSYLPKSFGGTVNWQKQANTKNTINCVDDRAARNVAHTLHGIHMPGKFDMTLLKSTIREFHWTRIHLLRYCKNREIYHLQYWVYPSISGFVFLAWMHAVYFNTVRYVPGHLVVFLLLHLLKNYAYYAMDSPLQNGFLAPSLEELYWALISGTKKRKKPCIEPLTVEREADPQELTASDHARIHGGDIGASMRSHNMDELYDENGNLVHVTRFPLSEIADAMKKSLKVRPYRKGFTVFKHTFQGEDAVDFLVLNGFAMTRPEAVSVGRRLEREKKLFRHVTKDCLFEDSNFLYCFLDNSDTDRYLSQTSHVPGGARLLELLGFYSRKPSWKNQKNKKGMTKAMGGADILESREHVEFPYATGVDHPRFTVKESLVIRSFEEKSRLKKEDEARGMAEAAEFGIVLSSRNLFASKEFHSPPPSSERTGYDSEGGLQQRGSMRDMFANSNGRGRSGGGNIVGRTARRGSALVGTALATGATAVAAGASAMVGAQRRSSGHGRNSGGSAGQLNLEVGATGQDVYLKLKDENNATLDKMLELQRKADEYDPYQYDSDNDVKTIQKKKRKKHIIVEKHLKKPISQEIGNIATTEVDMTLAKSLEKTKKHVNSLFYHMFDDPIYKIDRNIFPTRLENKTSNMDKKKKKKRGLFNRKASNEELQAEEERQKRLQMTPYDQQQDDMDKTLLINQYSHWNPWINRIAVVMQPLLEMAQTFLFFFRALFNLFTWQDPVLCFWLCFVGPPLALVLYVCPYRIIFFFLGMYWIGPQNYLLRIYRESKDGYEPPNFDLIVKKKKIEKADDFREMQFFSSEAPGNQRIQFRNIDPIQVKQIVVPSNVMMYGNRFYNWPPEPKYARVYASEAPSNLLVPGYAEDDGNGNAYESDSTSYYVFDQAARKKDEEEREKLLQKKKRKKGVGKKITDGLKKTGQLSETAGRAVVTGTEQVLGATAGVTVGAVKGTANITKSVVKGTSRQAKSAAKGTGNFLRLRKKHQKKYKSYSDDEDEYY